ncbi:MAG: maltotransferase domain-containing protein [Bacteroidota bacterium]
MKNRALIEFVFPTVNEGKFYLKKVVGDKIEIKSHIFGDGHDEINARILYKFGKQKTWRNSPLFHKSNDEWEGRFLVEEIGSYFFTVEAWVDHPLDWYKSTIKKIAAEEAVAVEILIGKEHLVKIAKKAKGQHLKKTKEIISIFCDSKKYNHAIEILQQKDLLEIIKLYPIIENSTVYGVTQEVKVEHKKTEFSSWYEFFPRSTSSEIGKHGTFKDCKTAIDFVHKLGFDVIYFPPIHPIGNSHRKGKNNSTTSLPGEPGSPWAIGNEMGGHKAIHPQLGSMLDFEELLRYASKKNIDIALDIAFQASPDHPYVKQHPEWFKWRPDGTVQYAENPPKKYQDVLPFNFETDAWESLWEELKSVFLFWAEKGVKIFRVDNPHTKPFIFWEYVINEVKKKFPETIFLSEAFTRPKIMARLAKLGFTQSYTYFTWRYSKQELTDYMNELTKGELKDYFRPNFWPNTPDILPYYIQNKGLEISAIRFVLAATLSSNYGLYGPVYDLLETAPMPGKEEYFNSEKYEIRNWDWQTITPFRKLIAQINSIRRENPALQKTNNINFCDNDNPQLLSFIKTEGDNKLYIIINLDPEHKQSGFCRLPKELVNQNKISVQIKDLISGEKYVWDKEWNYVELNPQISHLHIFEIK